jgi:hypothetical protein
MPQGGAALRQGQLADPREISLGLLTKRHQLQEIPLCYVNLIQVYLKPPPLQTKKGNCLAESRYEVRQDHHLTTGWERQAQKDLGLRMQGIHFGLGNAERRSQRVPLET